MSDPGRHQTVTLLCWNVAGRVRKLQEQQARVIAAGADLICLQEASPSTAEAWREALGDAGWSSSIVTGPAAGPAARKRPLLVLIAARAALETVEISGLPWPERVIAARVDGIEVVNVHSPTSSASPEAKLATHEIVAHHMACGTGPRIVCGDFNTPRKEHPDGRVWSFARDRYGRLREDRGERWESAELALVKGLEADGFRDAFRELHGFGARELSWEWQRWGGGYRLDHLIVSSEIVAREISYLHDWRKQGLSDHSPLYARIAWPDREAGADLRQQQSESDQRTVSTNSEVPLSARLCEVT